MVVFSCNSKRSIQSLLEQQLTCADGGRLWTLQCNSAPSVTERGHGLKELAHITILVFDFILIMMCRDAQMGVVN